MTTMDVFVLELVRFAFPTVCQFLPQLKHIYAMYSRADVTDARTKLGIMFVIFEQGGCFCARAWL